MLAKNVTKYYGRQVAGSLSGRSSPRFAALSADPYGLRRPLLSRIGVRHGTSETIGDDDSGHIEAKPNEGILFFNNILPTRFQWLQYLSINNEPAIERMKHHSHAAFDPVEVLKKALPADLPVQVTAVILRGQDGGAFVRFSHDPSITALKVEWLVHKALREHPIRPWFNPFHAVHARLVKGRPWLDDLYRPASQLLKVEFLPTSDSLGAKEITQEQLFSIFRPYGRIMQIFPQPSDSKDLPKFAHILFSSQEQAIMAKNCLHGLNVFSETDKNTALAKLKIGFERKSRTGWIRNWLFDHPRIVIPVLAALAAGLSIAIFDPVRTWNIKIHIKQTFDYTQNPIYRWLVRQADDLLSRRKNDPGAGMIAVWDERKSNIGQIESWLMESADTFIVVQGPRGSGKKELVVDLALRHRRNKLVIDCKKIQEARGDSATINAAAEAVGYRPVFSWINSISGLVDLAAQGAAGVKTGFSETLDGQLNQILNNTLSALRQISLEHRKKDDADANLDDDVWLEAHPEHRPVVVIDNFLHKNNESSVIYDKLAEWSARCTTNNIAHVIFLTTDVSFNKSLGKALPDRVFRQISLSDASPELARRFVLSHLDLPETGTPSIDGNNPATASSKADKPSSDASSENKLNSAPASTSSNSSFSLNPMNLVSSLTSAFTSSGDSKDSAPAEKSESVQTSATDSEKEATASSEAPEATATLPSSTSETTEPPPSSGFSMNPINIVKSLTSKLTSSTSSNPPSSTTDTSSTQTTETALDPTLPDASRGPTPAISPCAVSALIPSTSPSTPPTTPPKPIHLNLTDLDASLVHLGGRLTDLEFLARRIKAGESPQKAVQEIIDQSASEILKIYLSPTTSASSPASTDSKSGLATSTGKQWTPEQAWTLVLSLANSEDGIVKYNELVLSKPFASNPAGADAAMRALEQAEMISISSTLNGRATAIKPGKPVFLPAMRQLADDPVLNARMRLAAVNDGLKGEVATIKSSEEELVLLVQLSEGLAFGEKRKLRERKDYLLSKIRKSQENVVAFEGEVGGLKGVLSREF